MLEPGGCARLALEALDRAARPSLPAGARALCPRLRRPRRTLPILRAASLRTLHQERGRASRGCLTWALLCGRARIGANGSYKVTQCHFSDVAHGVSGPLVPFCTSAGPRQSLTQLWERSNEGRSPVSGRITGLAGIAILRRSNPTPSP